MRILLFVLFCLSALLLRAQTTPSSNNKLIQFSGLVVTNLDGNMVPVPYATISLPEKRRGTYSDHRGFFTIVVEKGDLIRFSCIGLETVTRRIPDTLTQDRYSVVQIMAQDTLTLPEVVIFPWPSREHFKIEFLKMDVTPELQRMAAENVANEYVAEARRNPNMVPYGGRESANFYLRRQAREYVYFGQTPPMNIFSPLAWSEFFKAWKEGAFRKKK
ncbi:MAG: carboxypeptidase-like regulatory domain-containing protein [Saprospiraceae bacterium]|nr:carboxypeptidase-like regulatory domain-containing protein [Saprospiraceae bacterium]MDW8482866.1 carboxypeptidase-like regulatory domain-containing protein [Saprospiraceae bacterium]